jgi:hypothetical protein
VFTFCRSSVRLGRIELAAAGRGSRGPTRPKGRRRGGPAST